MTMMTATASTSNTTNNNKIMTTSHQSIINNNEPLIFEHHYLMMDSKQKQQKHSYTGKHTEAKNFNNSSAGINNNSDTTGAAICNINNFNQEHHHHPVNSNPEKLSSLGLTINTAFNQNNFYNSQNYQYNNTNYTTTTTPDFLSTSNPSSFIASHDVSGSLSAPFMSNMNLNFMDHGHDHYHSSSLQPSNINNVNKPFANQNNTIHNNKNNINNHFNINSINYSNNNNISNNNNNNGHDSFTNNQNISSLQKITIPSRYGSWDNMEYSSMSSSAAAFTPTTSTPVVNAAASSTGYSPYPMDLQSPATTHQSPMVMHRSFSEQLKSASDMLMSTNPSAHNSSQMNITSPASANDMMSHPGAPPSRLSLKIPFTNYFGSPSSPQLMSAITPSYTSFLPSSTNSHCKSNSTNSSKTSKITSESSPSTESISSSKNASAVTDPLAIQNHLSPQMTGSFYNYSVSLPTDDVMSKKYICPHPGCGKGFPRQYNLKSHLLCHSSTKPHACDLCKAAFARKHDLQRHLRTLHSGKRPYECPVCKQGFNRLDTLRKHLKSEEKTHLDKPKIRELLMTIEAAKAAEDELKRKQEEEAASAAAAATAATHADESAPEEMCENDSSLTMDKSLSTHSDTNSPPMTISHMDITPIHSARTTPEATPGTHDMNGNDNASTMPIKMEKNILESTNACTPIQLINTKEMVDEPVEEITWPGYLASNAV